MKVEEVELKVDEVELKNVCVVEIVVEFELQVKLEQASTATHGRNSGSLTLQQADIEHTNGGCVKLHDEAVEGTHVEAPGIG